MNTIELRPAKQVMRLARLGSFHQSRLSFMRSLLRFLQKNKCFFSRNVWRINVEGEGVATYQTYIKNKCYSLVCFAHKIKDSQRSDRVIAKTWDATFVLYKGVANESEIERLSKQVPKQEAGRFLKSDLILSRANKSVRMFNYVVDCLAKGMQPSQTKIREVGYLMRTTAVYGNGKMGISDKENLDIDKGIQGAFRTELLTVWLIRNFTLDYVEQMALHKSPSAAVLEPKIRHSFGIGNSTGLGMAPFIINHPTLLNHWINARETALARVRNIQPTSDESFQQFQFYVRCAYNSVCKWHTTCKIQAEKVNILKNDLEKLLCYSLKTFKKQNLPWNILYQWGEKHFSLEGQELLVSLMFEPHASMIDELTKTMCVDENKTFVIDGSITVKETIATIKKYYDWALKNDYSKREENYYFWYISEEKIEPRLGVREEEQGKELEQPLTIGRDVNRFFTDLSTVKSEQLLAEFLLKHPQHRYVARRIQLIPNHPYAEIQHNLIGKDMLASNLLRCKLSFFGATHFDPKSDRWLRITMFQNAPIMNEVATMTNDNWIYTP